MSVTPTFKYTPVFANDGVGEEEVCIATGTAAAIETAQPYLEVVAPATLPEGYTFEAASNGRMFTVTVPTGGVEEGHKFLVLPIGLNNYPGDKASRSSVPVGHWKDGLLDCFGLGCGHVSLLMACCCPLILLGQVMQRLNLTWLANEHDTARASSTFKILFWITIASRLVPFLPSFFAQGDEPSDTFIIVYYLVNIVLLAFMVFNVVIICKTRYHIRNKYSIPEQQCYGCEDCCCAYWCTCCTVAQMARHTGDYDTYGARCCSETGLPSHATSIGLPSQAPSIV